MWPLLASAFNIRNCTFMLLLHCFYCWIPFNNSLKCVYIYYTFCWFSLFFVKSSFLWTPFLTGHKNNFNLRLNSCRLNVFIWIYLLIPTTIVSISLRIMKVNMFLPFLKANSRSKQYFQMETGFSELIGTLFPHTHTWSHSKKKFLFTFSSHCEICLANDQILGWALDLEKNHLAYNLKVGFIATDISNTPNQLC